ncbi:hypothetical protein TNCV_1304071 [Trichonephila clavipes]|nr:hypothetical protein TNCV_1304071 [Trichonephila clavipes]
MVPRLLQEGCGSLCLARVTIEAGHACSHPRVTRAYQAGLSRRSLAGVGLSESVRCHGPGPMGTCNNNTVTSFGDVSLFGGIGRRYNTKVPKKL